MYLLPLIFQVRGDLVVVLNTKPSVTEVDSFVTGRNEVVAKVMVLLVCVILFTRGSLPHCMLGYHHTPQKGKEAHPPPRRRHPTQEGGPGRRPPQKKNPLEKEAPPRKDAPPGIRSMSGWYASYWNDSCFLFWLVTNLLNVLQSTKQNSCILCNVCGQ